MKTDFVETSSHYFVKTGFGLAHPQGPFSPISQCHIVTFKRKSEGL